MPRYTVTINGREFDVALEYSASRMEATINGRKRQVQVHRLGDTRSLLLVDNTSHEVDVRGNGVAGQKVVFMHGAEVPVEVEDYNLAQMRKKAGISSSKSTERVFKAPMPGLVVSVNVQPGDKVKTGQPLVVIEAMKMENILKAKGDGVVKSVKISKGQSVEKGDTLVEFE